MSSKEPSKFELFFWEGEGDGSAYYSRTHACAMWPVLDPVKQALASEIGKLDLESNMGMLK